MNKEKGRVKLTWERGRDEVGEGCMGKRREMHVRYGNAAMQGRQEGCTETKREGGCTGDKRQEQ